MYKVYILQDDLGKLYKGITNNLTRRVKEHMSGSTPSTKRMVGIKVVFQEEFATRKDARRREVYLKSAAGRRFIKKLNIIRP
ncbi:MAG: GIY-YIG nuclease family protein [bacterium]|nr:GIY-YIG nuclease family protein [bacterium]